MSFGYFKLKKKRCRIHSDMDEKQVWKAVEQLGPEIDNQWFQKESGEIFVESGGESDVENMWDEIKIDPMELMEVEFFWLVIAWKLRFNRTKFNKSTEFKNFSKTDQKCSL